MTDSQLAELERLADAATPGPWCAFDDARHTTWWVDATVGDCECVFETQSTKHEADSKFAAASRTAIPALIAEVREARRLLGRARGCAVHVARAGIGSASFDASVLLADIDAAIGTAG